MGCETPKHALLHSNLCLKAYFCNYSFICMSGGFLQQFQGNCLRKERLVFLQTEKQQEFRFYL